MTTTHIDITRKLTALDRLCDVENICPDCVVNYLHGATKGGTHPFSTFEDSFLNIQEVFSKCIRELHQNPKLADMEQIVLLLREFYRLEEFVALLNIDIIQIEKDIDQRSKSALQLQRRLRDGVGDKTGQRETRRELLELNSVAGTVLVNLKRKREDIQKLALEELNQARLLNTKYLKSMTPPERDLFQTLEKAIEDLEKLKALFFKRNNWVPLIADGKIQRIFDRILFRAVEVPSTFWERCFSICRHRKHLPYIKPCKAMND